MEIDVTIKQGTLLPPLEVTCLDRDGLPVPLAAASGLTFRLTKLREETALFERPAVITDAIAAEAQYNWQAGDTDVPGTYKGVFIATFPTSLPMAFPSEGFLVIRIEANPVVSP